MCQGIRTAASSRMVNQIQIGVSRPATPSIAKLISIKHRFADHSDRSLSQLPGEPRMALPLSERFLRRALFAIALVGLILGVVAWIAGRHHLAEYCWVASTVPVVIGLLISIVRDVLSGRMLIQLKMSSQTSEEICVCLSWTMRYELVISIQDACRRR